jgi:hypothetical protein
VKLDQINFEHLKDILKTELTDCLPLDLNLIAERVIMQSQINSSNNNQQFIFELDDYLAVFNNYILFNLRTIKSVKSKNKFKNKKLNDLGGLEEVKERLKQIILWPIK